MQYLIICKWILLLFFLLGCQKKRVLSQHTAEYSHESLEIARFQPILSHAQWLDKVSRTVFRRELTQEEHAQWETKTKAQFLEHIFSEKEVSEFVFRFGLYFLQSSEESGYDDEQYLSRSRLVDKAFQYPVAYHGAMEFMKGEGGDFFKIFDFKVKGLMSPLMPLYNLAPKDTPEQVRRARDQEIERQLEYLTSSTLKKLADGVMDQDAFCFEVSAFPHIGLRYSMGVDQDTFRRLVSESLTYDEIMSNCENGSEWDGSLMADLYKQLFLELASKSPLFDSYESYWYNPLTLKDIKFVPQEIVSDQNRESFRGEGGLWSRLPNSSTNFNRKRAAYVLKTYLCDDLQPIDVISPDVHTRNRHADDPSCRSCHYRLDPLAGVFRNFGLFGLSFESRSFIVFDDFSRQSRLEYEQAWMDSNQSLQTGYVRSLSDESLNIRFDNFDGLSQTLRSIPEARMCLARRAFEFMTDKRAKLDGQFLDSLVQEFDQAGSSEAMRAIMSRIFLSQSFQVMYPDPHSCYDRISNNQGSSKIPCEISSILERKCIQCHSSTSSLGGLSLESYDDQGFMMQQGDNQRVERKEVLTRILNSIQATDPEKRMPYKQHFNAQDFQDFRTWIIKELE